MADNNASFRMLSVSFNMILLVFFVYLSTVGKYEESRVKKAFGSLIGAFGPIRGGVNITKGERLLPGGAPMIDPSKDSTKIVAELKRFIKERQIEDQILLSRQGQKLIIHLSDKLMFASGSAELQQEAKELLGTLSIFMKQSPHLIRIEGHTDNVPISTDKYPSNWELSTARAVAVLRFLIEEHHLPKDKVIAMGFGEYQPLFPNDTPENRAGNRRVSIIFADEN